MQTYTAQGTVREVQPLYTSPNGFTKRGLVVDTSTGNYPSPILFTAKKDKCAILDGVHEGDAVAVKFTIDGRRWDGPNGTRFFTDLTVWEVNVISPANGNMAEVASEQQAADDDGLPF